MNGYFNYLEYYHKIIKVPYNESEKLVRPNVQWTLGLRHIPNYFCLIGMKYIIVGTDRKKIWNNLPNITK